MKHPLKTLLISSVLTLPTTSGANAAGYQATLNEEAQQRGVQTQAATIKGTFRQLPFDLRDSIFGVLTADRSKTSKAEKADRSKTSEAEKVVFTLGYLNILDIYRLARTTRALNKKLQPILRAAKALRPTLMLSKLMPNVSFPSIKPTMLNLNGFEKVLPYPVSFDDFLGILLDTQLHSMPISNDDKIGAWSKIEVTKNLSHDDWIILGNLFPNSTPLDILLVTTRLFEKNDPKYYERIEKIIHKALSDPAIELQDIELAGIKLIELGKRYYCISNSEASSRATTIFDSAVKLFETAANNPNTTPKDILRFAEQVFGLGKEYDDRVAGLFNRVAKLYETRIPHTNPTPNDYITIAVELQRLMESNKITKHANEKYIMKACYDLVETLFELAANHSEATPDNIVRAAGGLHYHGEAYHDKAAKLYIIAGNHPAASKAAILEAAHRLCNYGKVYHNKAMIDTAVCFFKLAASHPLATHTNITNIAYKLKKLDPANQDEAAGFYQLAANHRLATPRDIITIATELKILGDAYHEKAAGVFQLAAYHKEATPFDIIQAGYGLSNLGSDYHMDAAKIFEHAAKHEQATPEVIRMAAEGLRNLGSAYHDKADKLRELANEKESRKS